MKQTHNKKLLHLKRTQKPTLSKGNLLENNNFVLNLSSTQFSEAELNLLQKGLNFAISPPCAPLAEIITNVESALQYNDQQSKAAMRYDIEQCILRTAGKTRQKKQNNFDEWCAVRKLKTRDVVYSRADKGNSVVIMDKNDNEKHVLDMINTGPYKEYIFKNGKPKDPLNAMIEEANKTRQKIAHLIGDEKIDKKFLVPNPKVATLYCLPKIHKNPLAMRPIASNIRTPTERMADWLVEELKRYPVTQGKSVKNSVELVQQLENVDVRRGEILVSFDVAALFPSVPVPEAIQCLREHLVRKRVPPNLTEAYIEIAQTCMDQNFFVFRGKFYKQTFGLSMGNKLSPFLADLFMSNLEVDLQNETYFPRVWKRYVDDIFAVVKERYLQKTLNLINSKRQTIKFTVEQEIERKLPFLDLLITRKEDNKLKFGIYRKPTSTDRYITSDSFHFGAQKQAAFHAMAHRLLNIPMENEEFVKEKDYIFKAAELNGYDPLFVTKIIKKHERKKRLRDLTTLTAEKNNTKRLSIPFYPLVTNSLKNILKWHGYQAVYKSGNTLRALLSNLKDKVPQAERSGIYRIECSDCPAVYIGQTRRKIKVRLREHKQAVDNERVNDSSVALHTSSLNHNINWNKAKLVKTVNKSSTLNAWESMFIQLENQPLMNEDDAPISSSLFNLMKSKLRL